MPHGIAAVMTRADHPTGTDRLAEAAMQLGLGRQEIVVNVQGDEPLLDAALIRRIAELLSDSPDASIATACHPIVDLQEAFNPNIVKLALDRRNYALYFSRATIPWARDAFAPAVRTLPPELPLYRHYGLYAYRVEFLMRYPALASAPIERFEALEQLRALWHGYKIVVEITTGTPAPGIDTPADLEQARAIYSRLDQPSI
jgi:3-deoxy-manno-octulosonate cytidylyltransferase (CMP-KDO synthetase)